MEKDACFSEFLTFLSATSVNMEKIFKNNSEQCAGWLNILDEVHKLLAHWIN